MNLFSLMPQISLKNRIISFIISGLELEKSTCYLDFLPPSAQYKAAPVKNNPLFDNLPISFAAEF